MKHIICYSGGHASALVAIAVVQKYGKENVVLVNHDISDTVEDEDIKRFKREVAQYLGLPITYANMNGWESKDQFDVCIEAKAFKTKSIPAICTNRLKTAPFMEYLKTIDEDLIAYYGFDASEPKRIERRTQIMSSLGYKTEYPLVTWNISIRDTREIGIEPPLHYSMFKHANCNGCLKAGRQHWYVVYCTRPDIFEKGKETENIIGYSIIKGAYLHELEPLFAQMKALGIHATEHIQAQTFWAQVRNVIKSNVSGDDENSKPCMCAS